MIYRKLIYTSIKFSGVPLNFLCLDVLIRGQKNVPLNYPFSIKNDPLNFTVSYIYIYIYIYIYNLLYVYIRIYIHTYIYIWYCSPKLPFPLKIHNLLYIYIYIYMYCTPKLPFFIKHVPLNFTIRYIYLYVLILFANTLTFNKLSYTPIIFLLYEKTSVFYYICVQEAHTPLISRHDMKLNFASVIPRVKGLQSI